MLTQEHKHNLLELARASIAYGLEQSCALPVKLTDYASPLQTKGACFVTLHINQQLRGCIGSLEAYRPLAEDVAENAFAAAFRDPRFAALRESELKQLEYHISILSPAELVTFKSENDLLKKLRPGIDGLVLEDQGHRGTFLPSVWESLPTPRQFLAQLKVKAGLPSDYWSDSIRIQRYTVDDIK
ncbi:COG2078: Uncharacterized ACR [hydrothermal vent metagenome]|uniref:COG2078: Uncharacterized ACR n=1 Tax=hydrothermal vent metagenome TaxID=652676 RepID=A0A3B1BG89_9ZZZZ